MKMSQITTKNDKNLKIFKFQRFYAFFFNISTDFVVWNVEKGQQRENKLSSRLSRRVFSCFLSENVSN